MPEPREIALYVWERALFLPYHWGGNDPMEGFDCSGLVVEGLKAAGRFGRTTDMTAHQMYEHFRQTGLVVPAPWETLVPSEAAALRPGCLVFFDRDGNRTIEHVEIVWRNDGAEVFTVGASGGGSRTVTVEDARQHDAYVKIRPADGWIAAVDPFL